MFRGYLYGYLNTFFVRSHLTSTGVASFKKLKYEQAANYLKLNGILKKLFFQICGVLTYFENIFYYINITIQFLRAITHKLTNKKQKITLSKKNIIVYDYGSWNLETLINKAGISKDDVMFLKYSLRKNEKHEKGKYIDAILEISFKEILISYLYSLQMAFFIKRKYGYRDVLFHTNTSFEYFLIYYFYLEGQQLYKICFCDTYDRWAYLFGSLTNYKIFIQHGILKEKSYILKKIGGVNFAFVFNDSQKTILLESIFSFIVNYKMLPTMQFSANHKLLKNGRKQILLICSHYYFEREQMLVETLNKNNNVYIKPHPLDDRGPYEELAKNNTATLLENFEYPAVDVVISYFSTLALEYKIAGIKVLEYDDVHFDEDILILSSDQRREENTIIMV